MALSKLELFLLIVPPFQIPNSYFETRIFYMYEGMGILFLSQKF